MGGKTPKQKESVNERIQSQQGVRRWNELVQDGFIDMEIAAIADAGIDHTERVEAAGNADVEAAVRDLTLASVSTPEGATSKGLAAANDVATSAKQSVAVEAGATAQKTKDEARLSMAGVGQDVAANTSSSLQQAAVNSASKAVNAVQNDITRQNARTQAAIDLASAAVGGYTMRSQGYRINGKEGVVDKNGKSYGYGPIIQAGLGG